MAELCERYAPGNVVLDVGCFSGDFLHWLPNRWEKLAIEPNQRAREIARRRGITLLADTIGSVGDMEQRVSVVTMLDVIEHLQCPLDALRRLGEILQPRGSIIILTGAADSLPWKVFGADYWYASLPEHVSFFTKHWFQKNAPILRLEMKECRRLSSVRSSVFEWSRNLGRLLLYTMVARLRRHRCPEPVLHFLPVVRRAAAWTSVPWWQEAKDHLLVVLQRTD